MADIKKVKPNGEYRSGKYEPKNHEKYIGDIHNIIYRSSWELKFMKWCDTNISVLEWGSETMVIPYKSPVDSKVHRYFVDFQIQIQQKDGTLKTYVVEIKPDYQTKPPVHTGRTTKRYLNEAATFIKNQAKWEAAKNWSKDRGYEFIIFTEYHLGIK